MAISIAWATCCRCCGPRRVNQCEALAENVWIAAVEPGIGVRRIAKPNQWWFGWIIQGFFASQHVQG